MVSLRYLLDTEAVSEPARPRPHPGFLRKLRAHADHAAIAATTWHEALFGLRRLPAGRRRDEIERYLFDLVAASFPILPYDAAAAEWHAVERARLGGQGVTLPSADGEIAAVAKVNDLTLVTSNTRHFSGLTGLSVESWWK
jgi:tRNA(fMet)-specific endonuclease VapC